MRQNKELEHVFDSIKNKPALELEQREKGLLENHSVAFPSRT
jgi:hypothetical protein